MENSGTVKMVLGGNRAPMEIAVGTVTRPSWCLSKATITAIGPRIQKYGNFFFCDVTYQYLRRGQHRQCTNEVQVL